MKKVILLNKASSGKTKIWSICTEGNEVVKEWGLEDGQMQITRDVVKGKNIGKANETSPEEQAELEAQRYITKKREEGYNETLLDFSKADLAPDFFDNPPDSFAPSKPATSIDPELEEKLVKENRAWYSRKWNGMRTFFFHGKNGVRIFSRRMEEKTDFFPWHAEEFAKLTRPGTVADCEMILNDDPDLIKEVYGGTKADKSIERQKTSHGKPTAIVFDILYWNGSSFRSKYRDRYVQIQLQFSDGKLFRPIELLNAVSISENKCETPIPDPSWEGMVLWDSESKQNIRFDGKPDRKSGAYKKKNFVECDVVAYEWKTGKGKNNDRPAKLLVGAYDSEGKLVPISEVGSGLCESHKDEILTGVVKLPITVEIKYEEVTPDKSFRLPIFLRWRQDKPTKECVLSDIKGYYDEE